MTDLPELIANVYRACGHEVEDPLIGEPLVFPIYPKSRPSSHFKALYSDAVGLDAFVRDIVPTLNERGWSYSIGNDPSGRRHLALIWKRNADALFEVSKGSPVEACFRAAYEALKDD